ncbi:UvrD-helicase domain-containing protein [Nitrogeniibacter mangrovi]|uniref:DNA 3'-5' helicase n=1 Tax=Nitrogeniibacter mangrovi TaxID=2016596 RepID=A0A6C1B5A2_9RHOO|nr:UvrD-helicase domain-containing protein [Nitrogeniibacter mangrovi]QID18199.1 UvrD-helicase domain-containing protein [Nitrogeniibacter mangrovi]
MRAEDFVSTALDPARSVVVEACAGSGKTWLLVSRMLRILLAGARPGDILAITYTRKAAREIGQRLRDWLRELASADDATAVAFLMERGLDEAAARAALPAARGLIERVEQASPGMTITTFHGWFTRILNGATLSSGMAGYALADAERPLMDEAWAMLSRRCELEPDGPEAQALTALFGGFGMLNTRALLEQFVARRAEWSVFAAGEPLDTVIARIGDALGATSDEHALAHFFAAPALDDKLHAYAALLGRNTAKDETLATRLIDALALTDDGARFEALVPVMLTTEGQPRARKPAAAQAKRLGEAGEAELLALHAELCERVQACLDARTEVRVMAFNAAGLRAGCALLEAFEALKRTRRVMDFADLEIHVDRLLTDEAQGPYLQARLDARYRHILLDEFQDTNPVQWRILLAWLGAYDADAWRPSMFLVGDPKQSIYRFRRADARIFQHAAHWLGERFDAVRLPNDQTWRNAPPIVDVVNAVFADAPEFVGFSAQTARRATRPGQVLLAPLVEAPSAVVDHAAPGGLRDPLTTPAPVAESLARSEEAGVMVAQLQAWFGRLMVGEGEARRPMHWGDVLILTRKRGILPEYERALREAGVPYVSVSRGQLLTTLEAADLGALLEFLVAPGNDLALAHVLRTPVFAASDELLIDIARHGDGHWWQRLRRLAASPSIHAPDARRAVAWLGNWMQLARRLPVHDLLDHIYHEADVPGAYQARVPPAMWPGVCANLEAFLALALNVDGGRFPSLPRFVDELRRLGSAGDEEAPDEGTLAESGGEGRVRIMTIHGAKGLEAPVVWMIDANNTRQQPDNYQPVMDWPVGAPAPTHFSLHATKALRGRARAHVFEADEAAARREALNLLYVAITRAEQCFVASGSVGNGKQLSDYGRIAQALERLGSPDGHGAMEVCAAPAACVAAPVSPESVPPCAAPVGTRVEVADDAEGRAFGTAMHALIEARTTPGAVAPTSVPAAIRAAADAILGAPDLQRFFDPAHFESAYNEVEIVRTDGRLGRIDRLVVFADEVWVLDYKSGQADAAQLAGYREQLRSYATALDGLFGARPVRGLLVFPDGTRQPL